MLWPSQCIEDPAPDIPCGTCQLQFGPGLVQTLKNGEYVACRGFHSPGRGEEARLRLFVSGAVWLNQLTGRIHEPLGFLS
jgi:hypothetical protein